MMEPPEGSGISVPDSPSGKELSIELNNSPRPVYEQEIPVLFEPNFRVCLL